jgi:hypothetical protein
MFFSSGQPCGHLFKIVKKFKALSLALSAGDGASGHEGPQPARPGLLRECAPIAFFAAGATDSVRAGAELGLGDLARHDIDWADRGREKWVIVDVSP